jgi:hypothetical protein
MNAVEIEEAVSALAVASFDAGEFPYAFLAAFGNKEVTLKRLRAGSSNKSDIPGAVLQANNIHIAVSEPGKTGDTLRALRASPRTAKSKVKFVVATDGTDFEAEDVVSGEPLACAYTDFANHFGFFLPLAGISTVRQIKDNPIDIRATARLNKLYVTLIAENEDWGSDARRQDLNQFMARLIFCFFAEDTGIFIGGNLFTACIRQMSDNQSGNTHEVIKELFRAMDTKPEDRAGKGIKSWAEAFPYVNGGLFTHNIDCPRFSRIARSYLLAVGELNWQQINPDIFGSMIQAVADDDERGELGMHYTSVPNILKVLNPLFLDDLREELEKAADNARKLLNLRRRIAAIRVFDPACGSGNFLVIAYIKLREIEAEIVKRRNDDPKSLIKLTNFYGIEIKSFAAEIARLALLIAEFQCNVRLIGQREACLEVLPLHDTGQIKTGNALRLDWLEVCPPAKPPAPVAGDLFGHTPPQGAMDFEATEAETYICGNPPYLGSTWQTENQKADLEVVFEDRTNAWKSLDYVAGWFMKAAEYGNAATTASAFVSTNSICQGQQVAILWPLILQARREIFFAHTSFKWANLASHNAGVTVVIVGVRSNPRERRLFVVSDNGETSVHHVGNINAYLVACPNVIISKRSNPLSDLHELDFGSKPVDGGALLLDASEVASLELSAVDKQRFVRRVFGSSEFINGKERFCIWLNDDDVIQAQSVANLRTRIELTKRMRLESTKVATNQSAEWPHKFGEKRQVGDERIIAVPAISSENRAFLPCGVLPPGAIVTNKIYAFYNAPLWNMALIASRLHWVWIGTVCIRMRTDFSYSNTLGWNTFPVPPLTENQKAALTRCAEDILLAREAHFPATIADLYEPDKMPADLRRAHDKNDETLERIYIGRRFKNDTERLEKLFDLYTKMTKAVPEKAAKQEIKKGKSKS